MAFPIITKEKQNLYEETICSTLEKDREEYIPAICGFYGRACRQMGKLEGANRTLCSDCALAEYCKTLTVKDVPAPFNKYEIYIMDRTGMIHTLYEGTTPSDYKDCVVKHFNVNGNGTTQIRI